MRLRLRLSHQPSAVSATSAFSRVRPFASLRNWCRPRCGPPLGDPARRQFARPVFRQSRLAQKKHFWSFWRARLYANRCILPAAERSKSPFRPREEKDDA
jgi:hypothetical protein